MSIIETIKENEPELRFNKSLERAFKLAEETHTNIFLLGPAGTGKSTFVHTLIKYSKKKIALLAPTGIAAINIGGMTIHSFFQFYPGGEYIPKSKDQLQKLGEFLVDLDIIIIDEISMVRSDVFKAINKTCKLALQNDRIPFGGLQMIFIGDLFQLPPVVTRDEKKEFQEKHGSRWFFTVMAGMKNVEVVELQTVYRQADPIFKEALDSFRIGDYETRHFDLINARVHPDREFPKNYPIIATLNKVVNQINEERLLSLDTPMFSPQAKVVGEFPVGMYPVDSNLNIRVGAHVMVAKNEKDAALFNGLMGIVTEIQLIPATSEYPAIHAIVIDTERGRRTVLPSIWENIKYTKQGKGKSAVYGKTVIGTFQQYPLRLAWALTVHRMQGQTLDRAFIDTSRGFFECGQAYVALSRVRSLEGLLISNPIQEEHFLYDDEVLEYFGNLPEPESDSNEIVKIEEADSNQVDPEYEEYLRLKAKFEPPI